MNSESNHFDIAAPTGNGHDKTTSHSTKKPSRARPAIDRLKEKLNLNGPVHPYDPGLGRCHVFTGHLNTRGYGHIMCKRADGRNGPRRAHRVAYEAAKGPIPPSMLVMHSCDNRACCNPAHLSPGTNADNSSDMAKKGRSGRRGRADPEVKAQAVAMRLAGKTRREIASATGLSMTTLENLLSGSNLPKN